MRIIAFTGMPLSGKSEAVEIAKSFGLPVVRMGDMVWEEVKNQGLELTDRNVGSIANSMRNKHGKDIWAKRTIEKIISEKLTEKVVVDGIRNVEEIYLFKKKLSKNFILIAITSSNEIRKNRALSRKRIDDSSNVKSIEKRDKRELGWGICEVISKADITISNEVSMGEFQLRIKQVLQNI